MTEAQFKKLEREWAAKLRAGGFRDIESPSGMIQSTDSRSDGSLQDLAALAEDRARGEGHRFAAPFDAQVWRLHVDGVSNRAIAKQLCVYRKLVDQAMWRLRGQMARRKPGPKRNPEGMRTEGLRMEVRLTRDAMDAVERLRAALPPETSVSALVRMGLLELARKTPMPTANCAPNPVRTESRKSA